MIENAPIILAIVGFALAAYTDFKTGYIYDWITYPLIAVGLLLQLWNQNWVVLGIAVAVLGIGTVIYYTGKMGGGDIKLLLGLTLLVPFWNEVFFPIMVLVSSALIAVSVLSVYYGIKYIQLRVDWKKENENRILPTALYVGVLVLYAFLAIQSHLLGLIQLGIVLVPLTLGIFYYFFENGIRKHFFLEQVMISSLEEDEIIAFDELPKSVQEKLNLGAKRVIETTDLATLEKLDIRKVPVYRHLPRFGPFLLVGLLVSFVIPVSVYAGFWGY